MSLTDRAAANRPASRKRGTGSGRDDLRIFLVAGEHSGDALGGKLMSALSARCKGRIHYLGVGGEDMEAAGLASQFPLSDVAVMGPLSILPRLPRIMSRVYRTVDSAVAAEVCLAAFQVNAGRRGCCGAAATVGLLRTALRSPARR